MTDNSCCNACSNSSITHLRTHCCDWMKQKAKLNVTGTAFSAQLHHLPQCKGVESCYVGCVKVPNSVCLWPAAVAICCRGSLWHQDFWKGSKIVFAVT